MKSGWARKGIPPEFNPAATGLILQSCPFYLVNWPPPEAFGTILNTPGVWGFNSAATEFKEAAI